jgi:hypothetical protein
MFPTLASAAVIEIDFDDFSDFEPLTNQIPGVTFSNATVLQDFDLGGSLNNLLFRPRSDFNVLFDLDGPMQISFGTPVSNFEGYFTYLTQVTIRLFDAAFNPVGGVDGVINSLPGDNTLAGTGFINEKLEGGFGGGFSFMTITGAAGGNSFAMDDLSFVTIEAVPEPSTLLLVGTGAAVLLRRRCKRRNEHA